MFVLSWGSCLVVSTRSGYNTKITRKNIAYVLADEDKYFNENWNKNSYNRNASWSIFSFLRHLTNKRKFFNVTQLEKVWNEFRFKDVSLAKIAIESYIWMFFCVLVQKVHCSLCKAYRAVTNLSNFCQSVLRLTQKISHKPERKIRSKSANNRRRYVSRSVR